MPNANGLKSQIENEIKNYLTETVNISQNVVFSQSKLVNRIMLFETKTYPEGKFTKQGKYKFWFDIITPRIDSEVKNIDFDTKNIRVKSDRVIDELLTIIANLSLKFWLRINGQAEELNSALEEGSGWGNVVWKKIKGGYERVDLKNFYVINQTAENLDQTPVIERHELSQSDLMKQLSWNKIDEVINECASDSYSKTIETQGNDSTTPHYEIYERNGEVCLSDLKLEKGEIPKNGDEKVYVLAKVIGAGTKGNNSSVEIKHILFADTISKTPYKEYHRGRYKGKWWREGLYEILFDTQVRINQIGNQLAQGLEWASKIVFQSKDKLIIQNIISDMKNGDIIKTQDIRQVEVRMQGFDQLANEWNRLIELVNDIANSREVVMGNALSSGTPLGAYNRLDANANKLFVFIQEKFAIPISEIFEEWLVPEMLDDLKTQDIVNLSGDTEMLDRARKIFVDDWYLTNLITLPPHTNEIADTLKAQKLDELKQRPELLMKNFKDMFDGFKKYMYIDITGEKSTMTEDTQTLTTAIQLEADPIRRSALLDMILKDKGFDVARLPKSQPPQPQQQMVANPPQMAGVNK